MTAAQFCPAKFSYASPTIFDIEISWYQLNKRFEEF